MSKLRWTTFPCSEIECCGLPWYQETLPNLWRFPPKAEAVVRERVWHISMFPCGGRLRMRCNTSQLVLRNQSMQAKGGLDIYVDGKFWRTVSLSGTGETEETICFEITSANAREMKDIVIYLPIRQRMQLTEVGVDDDTLFEKPSAFRNSKPFVLYGSSVAQGIGSARPGMSYAAILSRTLGLDYVNLGFGGNGKAEPEVVSLVSEIDACCYILDLGKSYGWQTPEPYANMVMTLRKDHPDVPIICITPIFASREIYTDYTGVSEHTRNAMREAVQQLIAAGDSRLVLIEGLDLLSERDTDGFSGDGVHPSDYGFAIIAERLRPVLESLIF